MAGEQDDYVFNIMVMEFLFLPARYKVAYGGRGGIKSWLNLMKADYVFNAVVVMDADEEGD